MKDQVDLAVEAKRVPACQKKFVAERYLGKGNFLQPFIYFLNEGCKLNKIFPPLKLKKLIFKIILEVETFYKALQLLYED